MIDFNKIRKRKSSQTNHSDVIPYFSNLQSNLINHINDSTYIIGCVAWLTNQHILDSLTTKLGVKIIINKEEYLSSKMSLSKKSYYKNITGSYEKITTIHDVDLSNVKIFPDYFINEGDQNKKSSAILTCGIVHNYSKMHHKFLVFFDDAFEIIGTWTGSYNMSNTSNYSLENAIFIKDETVAMEYINEFFDIYQYSEHYDWESGALIKKIKN